MFNLEQAIEQWRRQLEAAGFNSAEALDELECHLRDDVEAQVGSGLDAQSAFELAVRRLGTPDELRREFAKSAQPEPARRRIFLRYFYFLGATAAILIDLWTLFSFELSPAERAAAACGVAALTLYLCALPFLSWRKGGPPRESLLRLMKAMGTVVPLWIAFALLTALRIVQVQMGIVPGMILWSICAAYGLTALALALNQGSGNQGGRGNAFNPTNPVPGPVPPGSPCPPEVQIPVPSSTRFTPAARQALEMAREEALNLGHEYIGTEHVLLGVLKAAGVALTPLLQRSLLNSEAIRAEVSRLISCSPARPAPTALPLTPRARKALKLAGREADRLEHSPVGAEAILVGLLLEGSGVAAIALRNLGLRLDRLRTEIWRG